MKKAIFIIPLAINLFFIFQSCEESNPTIYHSGDGDTVEVIGEGPLVAHIIDVKSFTSIVNIGLADITINKAETQKVTLRAQQNIFDAMTYEVKDSSLIFSVKENHSIQTKTGVFIDIETPNKVDGVSIIGTGDITFGADSVSHLSLAIIGTGDIEAFDVIAEECTINITGVGTCNVHVLKKLNVTIAGVGGVVYLGNPVVTETISGIGTVEAGD